MFSLSTRNIKTETDRFPIGVDALLNTEALGILFKATANTQRPFLDRVIRGWKRYIDKGNNSLLNYLKHAFKWAFSATAQKKEVKDLLLTVMQLTGNDDMCKKLNQISWHSG
ncbi:MAG: hypothetical protein KDC47_08670, partial [Flavobacteriaceae bacterium]|nr:hypothetical protein [Flavobacteriaceae bacterium]